MASELRIYVDIVKGTLLSEINPTVDFTLPSWIQYSARTLQIVPVKPTNGVKAPFWSKVDIDNLTLKVGIGPAAGAEAPIAAQYTWAKVYDSGSTGPGYFTAILDLNTTEVNAAIGSAAGVSSTFEIQFAESGYIFGAVQLDTYIRGAVIPAGSGGSAPTPSNSYLTRDDVLALFNQCVRFAGNPLGASIKLDSIDGTQHGLLRVNNDGSFSADNQT